MPSSASDHTAHLFGRGVGIDHIQYPVGKLGSGVDNRLEDGLDYPASISQSFHRISCISFPYAGIVNLCLRSVTLYRMGLSLATDIRMVTEKGNFDRKSVDLYFVLVVRFRAEVAEQAGSRRLKLVFLRVVRFPPSASEPAQQ